MSDIIIQEKPKKERKPRKPLTDEQKAKRGETLKKAREKLAEKRRLLKEQLENPVIEETEEPAKDNVASYETYEVDEDFTIDDSGADKEIHIEESDSEPEEPVKPPIKRKRELMSAREIPIEKPDIQKLVEEELKKKMQELKLASNPKHVVKKRVIKLQPSITVDKKVKNELTDSLKSTVLRF